VSLEHLADEELMAAYQQGDTRAFEMLLKRHRRPVFNFLYRQVGDGNLAEDLLQDVFLRVIRSAARYSPRAKFTTWLYTIARNLCVDNARRAKHRRHASLDATLGKDPDGKQTLLDKVPHGGPAVDRQAMGGELRQHLQEAIASLGDDQREVFLMREQLNLPFKEIAEIIGCPENTVKSRMRYALEHLRRCLDEYRDFAQAIK